MIYYSAGPDGPPDGHPGISGANDIRVLRGCLARVAVQVQGVE